MTDYDDAIDRIMQHLDLNTDIDVLADGEFIRRVLREVEPLRDFSNEWGGFVLCHCEDDAHSVAIDDGDGGVYACPVCKYEEYKGILDKAMGGQDICIFCGFTTSRDIHGGNLKAHIEVCPEHPLVQARAEIERLQADLDLAHGYGKPLRAITAESERDEARAEIERLNGIIYRVAWRHSHLLGDIKPTEEIEPGYDLEDLHARLQTRIGIERLKAENEKRSERRKLLDTVLNLPIRWPVDTKTAYVLRDDILRAFLNR